MSENQITWDSLARWERYYLEQSIGRTHCCIPRHSKVGIRMVDKGLLRGFGFVFGKYVEWEKTIIAKNLIRELLGESEVAK